jgi:uncharacterized protein YndB with AHSA1/START domain
VARGWNAIHRLIPAKSAEMNLDAARTHLQSTYYCQVARCTHRERQTSALDALICSLVFLLLATLESVTTAAQAGWIADPAIQQRLEAGEVMVLTSSSATDPSHPRGFIRAAVRIRASPEAIWKIMTDCEQAATYVPGLRRCRLIDSAPDGSWQDIEHEVRYAWFLPTVRYVFHAEYERPHRIAFHRISGDLKEEVGTWQLTQTPDGSATIVEYEVYIDPGFWIPQPLVNRSLRRDLPTALTGLRERAESAAIRSSLR